MKPKQLKATLQKINGRVIIKVFCGSPSLKRSKKETRESDNKNDSQSHTNTIIYAKTWTQP
jgi:hypothetical protein